MKQPWFSVDIPEGVLQLQVLTGRPDEPSSDQAACICALCKPQMTHRDVSLLTFWNHKGSVASNTDSVELVYRSVHTAAAAAGSNTDVE